MLDKFVRRLRALGIVTTYVGNYPWIYLDTVNGVKVTEKYGANHGYHAFTSLLVGGTKFYDRAHLFTTIKAYNVLSTAQGGT